MGRCHTLKFSKVLGLFFGTEVTPASKASCNPTSVPVVELYILIASQTAGFYITELELCAGHL